MRLIVLLFALLFCTHAIADEASAPPSEEALSDARTISALFTDPLLVEEAASVVIAQRQNEFRGPLLSGPFYENLRPDTQRSLAAFVDTIPQIVRDETRITMSAVREDLTLRLTTRFSASELAALGTLFSHPAFRSAVMDAARAQLRGEPSTLTEVGNAELEALLASAAAQGAPHHWDVVRVVGESNYAVQQMMRPRVEQRILRGLCAAMADECPAHVRRMIAPEVAN